MRGRGRRPMFRPGFRPIRRPMRPWFGWGWHRGWGWLLLPLLAIGGCLTATFLLPLMRLFFRW
ncbi:MAG TPA: hypothetical protein EYP52_01025 [Anaerolineae bacterium]|nr:hypothetical protein [Anaerolineae bacterium]